MKIGLLAADNSSNFPNLPLMKISAWHKRNGDIVEWYDTDSSYDTVYVSKIFTESNDPTITNASKVVKGGSGYDLDNKLPYEIEHIMPDYSLYPQFDFAVGWLTRGCPMKGHTFCITPKKDGCRSVKVADVSEFWNGQKNIVLLDQNFLACPDRMELIRQLSDTHATIDFIGGSDIRYMNDEVVNALKGVKVKDFHFAWDNPREDLFRKFEFFAKSELFRPKRFVYVLTNFWSSTDEDLMRINALTSLGYLPYVMIYDKQKFVDARGRWLPGVREKYTEDQLRHFKTCQHLQRWCNGRFITACSDFAEYEWYKKWVKNGMPI